MFLTNGRDHLGVLRILVLASVLTAGAFVACDPSERVADCRPDGFAARRDLRYRTTAGVPAHDQSLDLYLPRRAPRHHSSSTCTAAASAPATSATTSPTSATCSPEQAGGSPASTTGWP